MKRLLLIGGGHSHVEVLRRFAMQPEPDVDITLATPRQHTPYSGMLPGLVAGHYRWDDVHVDLAPLAARASAKLHLSAVVALDPAARVAHCADGSRLGYDACGIDIGSEPRMDAHGAREHAIGVKPVERFIERWADALALMRDGRAASVAIVGGGAGGVEVLLAMQNAARTAGASEVRFALLTDTADILPSHARPVRHIFERVLARREVSIHRNARVDAAGPGTLHCADGRVVAADLIFWATSASAAPWIAASGVAIDDGGFLRVDRSLRSPSHPAIFGSGDVAAIDGMRLPKAGVFAVRQGPMLAANLRAALRDEPLQPFVSEPNALNLISTGDKCAVMAWKEHALEGAWVWRWKDWIDRRWMRRYR